MGLNVNVSFTINIDPNEWEARLSGIQTEIGVVPPHIRTRIAQDVQAHAENVVRDLYKDMGWSVPQEKFFVGYDDVTDWVWDMLPPGEETDYYSTLITEQIIDTWPALIGWHEEIGKGEAIDAMVSEDDFWVIAAQHKADL